MTDPKSSPEPKPTAPYASVFCPTDLSETGNAAIPAAYRLAADGGRVHLVHICEPPFLGNPLYGPYVQGYVPTPEETKAGEQKALERLHTLVPASAEGRGVQTEFHLVHGVNVANVITEESARLGTQVVVMGTHGRTGLGRILMGSVATDLMKKHGFDVVLVRVDPRDPEEGPGPTAAERIEQGIDRLASGLEGTGI